MSIDRKKELYGLVSESQRTLKSDPLSVREQKRIQAAIKTLEMVEADMGGWPIEDCLIYLRSLVEEEKNTRQEEPRLTKVVKIDSKKSEIKKPSPNLYTTDEVAEITGLPRGTISQKKSKGEFVVGVDYLQDTIYAPLWWTEDGCLKILEMANSTRRRHRKTEAS